MSGSRTVYVEMDGEGPVRIFKILREVFKPGIVFPLEKMEYREAVGAIRMRVFKKANFRCERCGKIVTWNTGHMDEKVPRGHGGEISIFNSQCLCPDCHIGDNPYSKHANRRPQFKTGPHD